MARLTGPVPRMLLGLGVSSVFIIFFLRNTRFSGVADAFREADVALILAGLGIYFAGLYFRAVRWHYLLRPVQSVPPHQLFPVLAIGFGMNNVLPFRAGEVVRAHVLHQRHGVSRAAALSSIFMARVFDGMMLTVFLSVGVAASLVGFESMEYAGDVLLAAMAFLVFGVSAAFIILYQIATHPQAAERLVTRVAARTPGLRGGQAPWAAPLIQGLRSAADRHLLFAGVWTSALAWGLEAFMYFLMGKAFGLNQPFPVYLLVAAAANLIISTPSTSGGVGPFEWATKAVLLIFISSANAEELATAYAAALHGLVLIPIALLGLVFLWLYNVPLRHAVQSTDRIPVEGEIAPKPQPH